MLTGPHGGRWVYELRQRFDLFCKISPLVPMSGLAPRPLRARARRGGVDILVVREQAAGIYQGRWSETDTPARGPRRRARLLLLRAARCAGSSRWRRGSPASAAAGCRSSSSVPGSPRSAGSGRRSPGRSRPAPESSCEVLDIDYAVYAMIRDPADFDVVVAPNLFGDVLADAGGLLLGSRGLCFGASFDDGRRRRLPDQPRRRPRPRGHRHAPTPAPRSSRGGDAARELRPGRAGARIEDALAAVLAEG